MSQPELAKLHPPIAENDPGIVVSRIELLRPEAQIEAYAAAPREARPNTPGVVLAMHVWGLDEVTRESVRRFAKAGFAAVAPDLYARDNPPDPDTVTDYTVMQPYLRRLPPAQVDGDLRAAALWLKAAQPQGKVGITGWCSGGAIALRQAVENHDVFDACASFYGRVEGLEAQSIGMPVCGSYGEQDTSIPAEGVRAFFRALRVSSELVIYPGAGHAFCDYTRARYVGQAAEDAWKRTLAFFGRHLVA